MTDFMEALVGIRYKDGGMSAEDGFDCWGLVRWTVKRGLGVQLSEKPIAWRRYGRVLPFSLNTVQRYDILFFDNGLGITTHIGIANSRTDFTHASMYHGAVVCEPVGKYRDVIRAVGRIKHAS